MKAVSPVIPGENHKEIRIAEHQTQYETLPAIPVNDNNQMVCRFELTESEIEKIKKTKSIFVILCTFGNKVQPIFITTEKPEIVYPEGN